MTGPPNPYRPGAGRVPPLLAGRAMLLDDFDSAVYSVQTTRHGDRPMIIAGRRGVGKTVLLNELARRADANGWLVGRFEAASGARLGPAIARAFHDPLRRALRRQRSLSEKLRRALNVFKSFQVKVDPTGAYTFGVEINPEVGTADTGDLPLDLTDLLRSLGSAAHENSVGVLLAIDELQDAPSPDIDALNIALHAIGQDPAPTPVLFIGAGLPSLPAELAAITSYAERLYDYRTLDTLTPDDTAQALSVPAAQHGITWDPDALQLAVSVSAGYPYLVQAIGKHTWDGRRTEGHISVDDVDRGRSAAQTELDSGLYRSRWERATPVQQQLLAAMALDGESGSDVAMLAERLQRRLSSLSAHRDALIKKGLIWVPARGRLAFTVPGMADYIQRQPPP